ncbi:MAG: hypothetical protein QOE36_1523 [Gaiellaceae bacterium]|jgi:FMN phosphatase YigB (HAD superfamily)|nr:hypothetical protein [Gaiellaceae bacterium]
MSVTAVFFDAGETLVDESNAWAELAEISDVPPHAMYAALGVTIERREHHSRVWELLGVDPPSVPLGLERGELYPDVEESLRQLHEAGYVLGIAGNQNIGFEEWMRAHALPVDLIVSSATLGAEKPSSEFFERLIELAERPAGEIAYVGDRVDNDVVPAAEAGMVAVYLRRGPWGLLQADWPEAARAHARIDSLADLAAVLEHA